jgi:maltodextrin utilization protein YvdJ
MWDTDEEEVNKKQEKINKATDKVTEEVNKKPIEVDKVTEKVGEKSSNELKLEVVVK